MSGLKVYLSLDTKQFGRDVRKADRLVQKASKNIGRYGMIGAAAFAAVTAKSTMMAIDAQETSNKFSTVFRGITGEANAMAAELRESYGMGIQESEELLGNTGDLLTGFGFTRESALGLSGQVQKLATDLASFQNLEGGSAEASKRITSAMLGETESMKQLGVVIRQDDPDFKALVKTIQKQTGATLQQAKAQAILKTIVAQSGNAMGDYARTQDGAANQIRLMKTRVKDLSQVYGELVLAVVDVGGETGTLNEKILKFTESARKKIPETAFVIQTGLITVKTALFNTWDTTKIVTENMITGFKNVGEGIGIFASNMVDDMTGSFKWLKDNWWTVLTNMHNLSGETWKSIAKLAADTMLASIRVMGGQLKDMWKAAATKSIPALLRSMTPIDNMVDELGRLKDSANDVLAGISTDLNLKEFKLKGADGAFDKLLDPDQYESVTDAIAENEAKKKQELLDAEAAYRKRLLDREAKEKEDAADDGAPGGPGDKRERNTMADQFTKIGAYMAGATETKSDGLLTKQVTLQQQMAGYLKLLASRGYDTGSFI